MTTIMRLTGFLVLHLAVCGCGNDLPTYPLRGRIELKDGEVEQLANSTVELALESDPATRASGAIDAEGRFEVQTLHKGRVLSGLPAGNYRARLLPDDDKPRRKGQAPFLRKQYLDFATSGLKVTVPTEEEVIFTVSKR